MPRLREVSRDEAAPFVRQIYQRSVSPRSLRRTGRRWTWCAWSIP